MAGRADYLELGDWNIACSMCGRKRKTSTMVRNWQGLYRCPEHDEPRQPQDFARGVPDNMSVPFAQLVNKRFVTLSVNPSLPSGSMPPDPRQETSGGFTPPSFVGGTGHEVARESGQDTRSSDDNSTGGADESSGSAR